MQHSPSVYDLHRIFTCAKILNLNQSVWNQTLYVHVRTVGDHTAVP